MFNSVGVLSVFQSRNYKLYFFGQGLSLIGTWVTKTAAIWLVYQLTDSPLMLGLIAFFSLSPSVFLSPIGGLIADKKNRHQVLLISQIVSALKSLALALFAFTGHLNIFVLFSLSCVQSLTEAIENPTRQAFIPLLISRSEHLSSAIALNSILVSLARLLGPAMAGILIAQVGAGYCFLADSISYIAIIGSLLAMTNLSTSGPVASIKRPWQDIKSGFHYAYDCIPIRVVLINLAVINLLATPIITVGPIFAEEILKGGSEVFGLFMTATGVGGIIGALLLSLKSSIKGLDTFIVFAPFFTGLCLIGFAQSRILPLSIFVLIALGLLLIIQISASNTLLQTLVDDQRRGRIMSLFMITTGTMLPIGNLLAGIIANWINAPVALMIEGALCMLSVVYIAPYRRKLRQAISQ